jgi:hypothetical protein
MLIWFILGAVVGAFVGACAAVLFLGLALSAKRADFESDVESLSGYYRESFQLPLPLPQEEPQIQKQHVA